MRKLKDLEVIFAILLIIFFFLPWLSIGDAVSAYQIPFAMEDIVSLLVRLENERAAIESFDRAYQTITSISSTAIALYTFLAGGLYLIPICSAVTIIRKCNGHRDSKASSIIAASIPIGLFVFGIVLSFSQPVVNIVRLNVGAWLSLMAAVGLLLATFEVIDAVPPQTDKPLFKEPEFLLATLLLVSFFLPWISVGNQFLSISVAGYKIPQILNTMGGVASVFSAPEGSGLGIRVLTAISYGLYLIPISCLTTMVRQYKGLKSHISSLVAALLLIVTFGAAVFLIGLSAVVSGMGIGAWLSLIGTVGIVIVVSKITTIFNQ